MKKKIVCLLICSMLVSVNGCANKAPDYGKEIEKNDEDDEDEDEEVEDDNDEDLVEEYVTEDAADEAISADANNEKHEIYEKFLGLIPSDEEIKVIVDGDVEISYQDWENEDPHREFTFEELMDEMQNLKEFEGSTTKIEPQYTYLTIDGEEILVVQYSGMEIDGPGDKYSTSVHVYNAVDGKLYLTYAYSTWSRSDTVLLDTGYIWGMGSAGAGEEWYDVGYINSKGEYVGIYAEVELYTDWIGMYFDQELYYSIYDEFVEDESNCNVIIREYNFDGDFIYVYEPWMGDKLSAKDEQFLAAMRDAGYEFHDVNDMRKLIEDRFTYIGSDISIENGNEIDWIPVK